MRVRAVATFVVVCAVGFGGFGILSADAANPAGFKAVVNSLARLPAGGVLEGVSCASASQCAVVGQDIGNQPLALTGDPSSWGLAQMHEITLSSAFGDDTIFGSDFPGVTCTSSAACVAVGNDGNDEPLMLVGNPATWGPAQAREIVLGKSFGGPGSSLSSISCTSATACVAVGDDGNLMPLVLVGNPATWGAAQAREITLGSSFGFAASLQSIACTSSTSCVAVGWDLHETQSEPFFNDMPFVLVGNPATWTAAQAHELTLGSSFGSGGSLESVACVSASSCVAVGDDENRQPLVVSGDPSSWGVAQAYELTLGSGFGSGGFLRSVACTSSSSCVAVGGDKDQPLVVMGDPSTTWSAAQAHEISLGAGFSSGGWLRAISCASSSACTATGTDGNTMPLVLSGDPATWGAAQARNFNLKGMGFGVSSRPSSLTCVSATSCLELGSYGSFQERTYLLQGNPGTWDHASETTLTGISPYGFLNGGTCPTASFCVAVGGDAKTGGLLVLAGDPSTFATAPGKVIPLGTAFGSGGLLQSVACSSTTSCVAVGYDAKGEPIVLTGNPATWTSASVVAIKLSSTFFSRGYLFSVTCSSATACVAVGVDGGDEPLVFSGNPSSWTASSAKRIKLTGAVGRTGLLDSVSCTSSTYCVAIGLSGRTNKPLVVTGNPAQWTAKRAFNLKFAKPTAATVAGLGAAATRDYPYQEWSVSCDKAAYCVAIGGDKRAAVVYIAGNPKKWKGHPLLVRPAKSGTSFATADLTTTGCTTNKCFAAGRANGGDFVASFAGG